MSTIPLSRNRNYRFLWGSQVLSEGGLNAATIAFPLLVLALTGSPAAAGLVLGVDAAVQLAVGLPAGALVDRWNRKKVMLACEAAQAIAAASLAVALWMGVATIPHMIAVAAVMGCCRALFEPAEESSLPSLVPAEQLGSAVSMNAARGYLGQLGGTAIGGFLFAAGRLVPFATDAVMHLLAFFGLAFVRVPDRVPTEEPEEPHLFREMRAGLRWVWHQRHVRVTSLCAISLNFFFTAFYVVIIVLAKERGVPSGAIGVMAAMLGVGGILGALAAPYLHRVLSPYVSIIGVFWTLTVLTPVAMLIHNGYLMGALFVAMALLPPTANTTINTYQLLLTPDGLRGRLTGVLGVVGGVSAAAGPAFGGWLTQIASGSQAVLLCAVGIAVITVLVTVNPTMRTFPRPEDVAPVEVVVETRGPAAGN